MGFFSGMRQIGNINMLLKQIEPKIKTIQYEASSGYPNRDRIREESRTIAVLMNEIFEIADNAPRSVQLAPYYLFGNKMNLFQISSAIASIIEAAENI